MEGDSRKKVFVLGLDSENPDLVNDNDSLVGILRERGMIASNHSEADLVIYLDFDKSTRRSIRKVGQGTLVAVISHEPSIVRPQSYDKSLLRFADYIFRVGQQSKTGKTSEEVSRWPQTWNLNFLRRKMLAPQERLDNPVIINANKISFYRGENYSLRRIVVDSVPDCHLWGQGWNHGIPRSLTIAIAEFLIFLSNPAKLSTSALRGWFRRHSAFQGTSRNKLETLSGYKFSFVIENSMELLTEKLFDCFFAGTLPIYVGPKAELFEIPTSLLVQVPASLEGIETGLEIARGKDLESWQNELFAWLSQSSVEQLWAKRPVNSRIVDELIKLSSKQGSDKGT